MCDFDSRTWTPLSDVDGRRVSESPWGPDDQIGRLNWVNPVSVRRVLERLDAGGTSYDLAVDYQLGMPCYVGGGDPKYDIWMTHTPQGTMIDNLNEMGSEINSRSSYAGDAFTMYTHTGTHMDMLNHFGSDGVFWNGWTAERELGSRHWRVGGPENYPNIVARGLLLDVAALHGVECLPPSYEITPNDLIAAAERQKVEFGHGDIAMIRTGRMRYWPDQEAYSEDSPGIGLSAAQFLADEAGVMCVGSDNDSVEVYPSAPDTFFPVHSFLFGTAGAQIIESLWLEDLAAHEVYEVAFIGGPLKLTGATGSPIRPLALPLEAQRVIR